MATLTPPAIVILGPSALATARKIQTCYPGSRVHGLRARIGADTAADIAVDERYASLGEHLRALYTQGTPLIVLCAAGIVIRSLAPALANKGAEPPVLAVAEDGSAVVPLLGGLAGVNDMAREIAAALETSAAITTSGELRFGTCLLNPPHGYVLASLEQGKRFVSDLLAGASTRIEGHAPWLAQANLPHAPEARLSIRISEELGNGSADELLIHPRCVVAAVLEADAQTAERVRRTLQDARITPLALAALLAPHGAMNDVALRQTLQLAADTLGVPLRFAGASAQAGAQASAQTSDARTLLHAVLQSPWRMLDGSEPALALAACAAPIDPAQLGHGRGTLSVVGLGPGSADLMVPAARRALDAASDILGYATYVNMAGPFRADQHLHSSDNREELQRARHAFELASQGRAVAVVSSGDPGVFAMAAAVLEALDGADDPAWAGVELNIVPGVSAAFATAAQAGAPLGHDFCLLSLSDNLKPWSVIEARLRHAAQADLVMAFYNPISRARPWQLDRALEILRAVRTPDTVVVLGRDIGRPGASLSSTTLGALRSDQVDMRTTVIVGSSTTRCIPGGPHGAWIYTPRWYPETLDAGFSPAASDPQA